MRHSPAVKESYWRAKRRRSDSILHRHSCIPKRGIKYAARERLLSLFRRMLVKTNSQLLEAVRLRFKRGEYRTSTRRAVRAELRGGRKASLSPMVKKGW